MHPGSVSLDETVVHPVFSLLQKIQARPKDVWQSHTSCRFELMGPAWFESSQRFYFWAYAAPLDLQVRPGEWLRVCPLKIDPGPSEFWWQELFGGRSPAALPPSIGQLLRCLRDTPQISSPHFHSCILQSLLRYQLLTQSPVRQSGLMGLFDGQLAPALMEVHQCPQGDWSLEQLAELCHLSRSSFCQRFRQVVGCTVFDYLTEFRLEHAQSWLASGQHSLSEVAEKVGYAASGSLSKALRRRRNPRGPRVG